MENIIINVVIGLVLIYLAMAVLLMKLQESIHGGFFRGRVQNMHNLLSEAVGRDGDLKARVLKNPLLFSLSTGKETAKARQFLRPTGPSSVPPDLFAKALLMELHPEGKLPSSETLAPLAFMDSLLKSEKQGTQKSTYLNGLRALIPAANSGWPEFEMAIAIWFSDIGDRANGWYKRSSSLVGMWIAIGLCAVLNVDTHNIINTLGGDSELRQGLGNLADLVLRQRAVEDKTTAAPTPADALQDPAVRAIARLVDANAYVSEAYFKDKAITKFGYYITDAKQVCTQVTLRASVSGEEGKFVSNSDTWVSILPALLPFLEKAVNRVDEDVDVRPELRESYICLSNVSAWVRAASTASNSPETRRVMLEAGKALDDSKFAVLSVLRNNQQQGGLRRLFRIDPEAFARCAASPTVNTSNIQACVMREQDLLNRLPLGHTGANWRQQFCEVETLDTDPNRRAAAPAPTQVTVSDPAVTPASAAVAPASKVAAPVSAANAPASKAVAPASKAIGPVSTAPAPAPFVVNPPTGYTAVAEDSRKSVWARNVCGDVVLRTQPKLDIPAGMTLSFKPWNIVFWGLGVLISALFISLGAPVLFDTLKQWVNLRNAGGVRDATKSALTGGGTLALPMLAGGGAAAGLTGGTIGGGSASGLADAGIGTLPVVEGAGAGFEEQLTPREVQALKQRLGVQPSTGGFDDATRAAIRTLTGSDRVTLASYVQLMRRPPVQAGQIVAALPTGRAQLRQPFDLASTLAGKLNVKLDFPNRVPGTETTFSDELRAMAVLFRFKSEAVQDNSADIFKVADAHPEQLDQIDQALRDKILNANPPPFARIASASWMDVALGELGQVERNGSSRATSNPRVCEYLDAVRAKLGDGGDSIAWCGAFVTWVLKHSQALVAPTAAQAAELTGAAAPAGTPQGWTALSNGFVIPGTLPERAIQWKQWPRPAAAAGSISGAGGVPPPTLGDVVVVDNGEGGNHVGFVFQVNTASAEFWMLGGNQRGGTRVSLSRWRLSSIC